MATYEIRSPNGEVYEIEGPDDADPSAIIQQITGSGTNGEPTESFRDKLKRENPGEYDPSSPEWQAKYGATSKSSGFDNFREGIGQGLTNVARQLGNITGFVSDEEAAEAKRLDQSLLDTTGGKIGSFVGEVAATAPIAAGGAGLLARTAVGARALANPIARGAAEGAIQGAIVADPNERGVGAITGGAFGSVLPLAAKAVRTAAGGLKRTESAQKLIDEGVDLTPGQLNPNGFVNQIEESLQSVPIVGSVIKGARDNAQNTFQAAATRKAAAPGASIAQSDAASMLDEAYKSFEPLYDASKGFPVTAKIVRTSGGDVPLNKAFADAARDKGVRATDQQRKAVNVYLQNQLTRLGGKSDDLLQLRSVIRAEARKARSQGGDDASAELLDGAEKAITDALESQLPKKAIKDLATADAQYGLYKTLEDAVAKAGDKPGGFTAADLARAVRQANGGTLKGNYARGGGGDLRDLAKAGADSLNSRSPPTGARLAAILSSGALGIPLLAAAGTQTGRKIVSGTTNAQKSAMKLLEGYKKSTPGVTQELLANYLKRISVAAPQREE